MNESLLQEANQAEQEAQAIAKMNEREINQLLRDIENNIDID